MKNPGKPKLFEKKFRIEKNLKKQYLCVVDDTREGRASKSQNGVLPPPTDTKSWDLWKSNFFHDIPKNISTNYFSKKKKKSKT